MAAHVQTLGNKLEGPGFTEEGMCDLPDLNPVDGPLNELAVAWKKETFI